MLLGTSEAQDDDAGVKRTAILHHRRARKEIKDYQKIRTQNRTALLTLQDEREAGASSLKSRKYK